MVVRTGMPALAGNSSSGKRVFPQTPNRGMIQKGFRLLGWYLRFACPASFRALRLVTTGLPSPDSGLGDDDGPLEIPLWCPAQAGALLADVAGSADAGRAGSSGSRTVVVLEVKGPIGPATVDCVSRGQCR
jgi:hypothetical protein